MGAGCAGRSGKTTWLRCHCRRCDDLCLSAGHWRGSSASQGSSAGSPAPRISRIRRSLLWSWRAQPGCCARAHAHPAVLVSSPRSLTVHRCTLLACLLSWLSMVTARSCQSTMLSRARASHCSCQWYIFMNSHVCACTLSHNGRSFIMCACAHMHVLASFVVNSFVLSLCIGLHIYPRAEGAYARC